MRASIARALPCPAAEAWRPETQTVRANLTVTLQALAKISTVAERTVSWHLVHCAGGGILAASPTYL